MSRKIADVRVMHEDVVKTPVLLTKFTKDFPCAHSSSDARLHYSQPCSAIAVGASFEMKTYDAFENMGEPIDAQS